jgi:hypothetical protein
MKNRVIIGLSGGNIYSVFVDNPKDLEVIIFDEDNMEALYKTRVQIDEEWKKLTKGTKAIY